MIRLLLADNDHDLLDVMAYALRRDGFQITTATAGPQVLQRWQQECPDLVVLATTLPGLNGVELCQRIRQSSMTPVILLGVLNSEDDIVRGFQAGADDYLVKPFSLRQLALRIRAVWRRSALSAEPEPQRELRVGRLVLDLESHEVWYDDEAMQFTRLEFRLLYLLAANAGRVINTSRMVDYAWEYEGGDGSLLKTHISHIRKKLRLPRQEIREIQPITRVGYRLLCAPAEAS